MLLYSVVTTSINTPCTLIPMPFDLFYKYLYEIHKVVSADSASPDNLTEVINDLFLFLNDRQGHIFPEPLCSQAIQYFRYFSESVLPQLDCEIEEQQEIEEEYQSQILSLQKAAEVAEYLEREIGKIIQRLRTGTSELDYEFAETLLSLFQQFLSAHDSRHLSLLQEFQKRLPAIREQYTKQQILEVFDQFLHILTVEKSGFAAHPQLTNFREIFEYVLHAYFAGNTVLIRVKSNQGRIVPLLVAVDCNHTTHHVEFFYHEVDEEMQASADIARRLARQYLLDEFEREIPEQTAVRCHFLYPAAGYQDTSASMMIGLQIIGEVLKLEGDPSTLITRAVEQFGIITGVGWIPQKVKAAIEHQQISRLLIPESNVNEATLMQEQYATIPGMSRLQILPIHTFVEAVELYYGKEQIEECKLREREKLSWQHVRAICADITDYRMGTVQKKYDPALYLQREKTLRNFEKFLQSPDKKCFILIGKSGVGKSNFLLSLYDEFQHHSDENQAMLMYDGASLRVEPSITVSISQDFMERAPYPNWQCDDIWHEINQIDMSNERVLILYVDAINENPHAKALLQQLNELVQKPWPWLKIVCSSRPETWQTVKQGVRLAEKFYYREEGTDTVGVELKPFSYSEQMEPFSREELPEVYGKYQQKFNVQTPYYELDGEQRKSLHDPLNLWLVASTYENSTLPRPLPTELIAAYINALITSARLSYHDLKLLETRLVSLMLKEKQYTNIITMTDIQEEEGLYDNIYNDVIQHDGQRKNRSFTNLVDAAILNVQSVGSERNITFKYERFYDYFIGKAIFEIYRKAGHKQAFWNDLFKTFEDHLFLWGALRQVLSRILKEKDYAVIEELGRTNRIFQADLLVSVFTEHYARYQRDLHPILLRWLNREFQNSLSSVITTNVALSCQIATVLEQILVHPNKDVRVLAMQNIYALWQANADLTTNLLYKLPQYISVFSPKRSFTLLFKTLVPVSTLLVCSDYIRVGSETRTFNVVQQILKRIVDQFRWLKPFLPVLAKLLSYGGVRYIAGIQREGFPFSVRDAMDFFPADDHKKEILRYLTSHFGAAAGEPTETVEALADYIEQRIRARDDNCFIYYASQLALIAHIKAKPVQATYALDRVLNVLDSFYPPTKNPNEPTAPLWNNLLTVFLAFPYREMNKDDVEFNLRSLARIVRTREHRYLNRVQYNCGEVKSYGNTIHTIYGYYFDIPEAGRDLLKEIIHVGMQRGDHVLVVDRVFPALGGSAARHDMPEAAAEAMADYLELMLRQPGYIVKLDDQMLERFWRATIDTLSQALVVEKYRPHVLDLVENFKDVLPEWVIVQIRGHSRKNFMKFYMGEAVFQAWVRSLHDSDPAVRDFLKQLFQIGCEVKNLNKFVLEVLMNWVNILYPGEELFRKT